MQCATGYRTVMRERRISRVLTRLSSARAWYSTKHDPGRVFAQTNGFDPASFTEQEIVWGDLDSFQHVNNVRYLRFFESGRMVWLRALAEQAGGESRAKLLLQGKGISMILKKIDIDFKRPVNYPDTLLIAHKLLPQTEDPAHLIMSAIAYSKAQKHIVAQSNAVCVWYDYDKLAKAKQGPPPEFIGVIERSRSFAANSS